MAEYLQDLKVRYSDFRTIENFKNLVKKFLSYDINIGGDELEKERISQSFMKGQFMNPIITSLINDSVLGKLEEVKVLFISGFLEPRCKNLHYDYITFLASKTLETTHFGLLGVYNRVDPYKKNLQLGISNLKKIRSKNILQGYVANPILNEMELTLKFIKERRNGYSSNFESQICFNLDSNELIALFQKLKDLNVIDDLGHANLGFLMEQYFKYRNSRTGTFSKLKNCASAIEGAHNGTKSLKKAKTRLNEKFNLQMFSEEDDF